ncbi:phage tail fiber protein [Pseudomonas sp. B392_1p]|uniref:phage tail fiber protein n=1 Tax=Pseudomonas sp. B392_1p TaxID=3457507 RepID=UPI003FD5CE54
MSAFSDYLENTLINATLRGANYTGGGVYVALFTADPTDAGTGAELNDSAYVRQRAHTSTPSDGFTVPANGSSSNARNMVFPAIVDAQKTITHWGVFDAQNAGNLLYHAPMQNPKTLDPTDVLSFPIGSLIVTLS